MYDIDNFSYVNYIFDTYGIPDSPYINVNLATASTGAVTAAIDTYLSADGQEGQAVSYRNAMIEALAVRDSIVNRFEKDVMEAVGLAVIDPVANTYVANKKANEVFEEAGRNVNRNSVSNLRAIAQNAARLKNNILTEDDGDALIYDENEQPVVYDESAITIASEIGGVAGRMFISQIPNATGNNRVWISYESGEQDRTYEAAYSIRYDGGTDKWVVVSTEEGSTPVLQADTVEGLSAGGSDSESPSSSNEEPELSNSNAEPELSNSSAELSNSNNEEP